MLALSTNGQQVDQVSIGAKKLTEEAGIIEHLVNGERRFLMAAPPGAGCRPSRGNSATVDGRGLVGLGS